MVKRWWRVQSSFFLGSWLFFMTAGRSRLFRDPGTFWHTVVGRKILTTGSFFDTDPFSFTCGGKRWIPHQWLGECIMAVLDGVGGLDTLLLATATLLAALYTWVAYRLLKCGLHWLPTVLVVALTIAASANHFHVRPHLATIVFLGLTFGWLIDYESGRAGMGRMFWLVLINWGWSNIHGGVIAGLMTVSLVLACWCVFRLIGLDSPIHRPRQLFSWILLILGSILAFVINPYGLRLPEAWWGIVSSPALGRLIEEHAPLDALAPGGLLVMMLGLLYLGTLASVRPWRPRVTWLIPCFWLCQAFMRVRHTPLFGVTASLALADMLPYTGLAAYLARPGRELFEFHSEPGPEVRDGRKLPALAFLALPSFLISFALVCQWERVKLPVLGSEWVVLDPDHWPVDVLPELRRVQRDHPGGTRFFNDFRFGGFLIYNTPGLRVFIDDRCELYGDDGLIRYSAAAQSDPAQVDSWAVSYGIKYGLVDKGSKFDTHMTKSPLRWRALKRARAAALYENVQPFDPPHPQGGRKS